MNQFSNRSKKNLQGIHPQLVKLMEESITHCPVDFTITDGVRTTKEQQALYARGRTTPGKIVTHCDGIHTRSNHQPKADGYGYAVDLYPFVNGSVQVNDVQNLTIIAKHIKQTAKQLGIPIEWGGDWAMRDYPHIELKV